MIKLAAVTFIGLALILGGCARDGKDYARALPPGAIALEEVPVHQWPDFSLAEMDRRAFLDGIEHSLAYLEKPSAGQYFPIARITQDQVVRGLQQFRDLIISGVDDREFRRRLEQEFRVYRSVGWDGSGEVLFTGYYTPIFEARLQRDQRFRFPVYARPDDLISGRDGKTIAQQRLPNGTTRPYPSAAQLHRSGALQGNELVWFADPFDAYIVVVQGSAKLRLAGGKEMEIGYAGTNGHEYHPIAHDLVADGHIGANQINLTRIREFFRMNPDKVDEYINRNPRIVFFKEAPGGPFGSLGQRVTTNVSIATDKKIFPRAALTFVDTRSPDRSGRIAPYQAFRLDQDTGGAITAPGRADLYMGVGHEAERRAGHQLHEGYLYYLVAR